MKTFNGVFIDENYLSDGFIPAKRINFLDYDSDSLLAIIKDHCIDKNQPIVISNVHESPNWDTQVFTLDSLKEYCGDLELAPSHSNNIKKTELLGDYIQTLQKLYKLNSADQLESKTKKRRNRTLLHKNDNSTSQSGISEKGNEHTLVDSVSASKPTTPTKQYKTLNYTIEKAYAKDITCPVQYKEALKNMIPDYLHPHGDNDLFSLLPPRFKAENLMCYLAQSKTGTPMHRDICATVGHNLMTMAAPGGYAEWFIVVNEDREKLASVMRPVNPLDKEHIESAKRNVSVTKSSFMESERGWLRRSHLKTSELTAQVILQQAGDLVIIPSRAYHQVRNVGVTVKIAWNRVTAQTLTNAFEDQLPLYKMVCRPEVFKCKAIVYYTLQEWNRQLRHLVGFDASTLNSIQPMKYGRDSFIADSNMLLELYLNKVLYPEILPKQDERFVIVDVPDEFCTVKCDFCHADVFYKYYECEECDYYDLCMECYAAGRSCLHTNKMEMRRSDADLASLTDIYKSFIDNSNQVLGESVFIDKSQCLDSSLLDQTPNLATICRRLQKYRSKVNKKSNVLSCSHCLQNWTVAELAESGISLKSIFQRSTCKRMVRRGMRKDLDVFVCEKCAGECDSCEPLVRSNDSMEDVSLVYYAPPSSDHRSMGAYFDIGIKKACDYPSIEVSKKRKPEHVSNEEDEIEKDDGCEANTEENYAGESSNARKSRRKNRVEIKRRSSKRIKAVRKKAETEKRGKNPYVSGESSLELRMIVEACREDGMAYTYVPDPKQVLSRKKRLILPMPARRDNNEEVSHEQFTTLSQVFNVSRADNPGQTDTPDQIDNANKIATLNEIFLESQAAGIDDKYFSSKRSSGPRKGRVRRSPPPFVPFPKTALELYFERVNKEEKEEKPVFERLLEAAQRKVREPAKKARVPNMDFDL